jgi:hypothetical protein
LIWVVASVFQQSKELKAQRREFEQMSHAMQAQVRAMQEQTLLLEDERRRRDHESAKHILNELLSKLAHEIDVEARTASLLGPNLVGASRYRVFAKRSAMEDPFDFILRNRHAITSFWDQHEGEFSDQIEFFRGDISLYGAMTVTIDRILKLRPRLSEDTLVRLDRLELENFLFALDGFLAGNHWHNEAHDQRNFRP